MSDFIKFAVGAGFWRFAGCFLLVCMPLAIIGDTANRLIAATFDWWIESRATRPTPAIPETE